MTQLKGLIEVLGERTPQYKHYPSKMRLEMPETVKVAPGEMMLDLEDEIRIL
jgi:hypothetical protein